MGYSFKKLATICQAALVILIFSNQVTAQNQAANTSPIDFEQKTKDWLESKVTGFTENKGQVADKDGNLVPQVLFKAASQGGEMYITTSGITYVFSKTEGRDTDNPTISSVALKMDLVGATIKNENIITKSALPGRNNYFLPHIPDGAMNTYTYQHITVKNIYPGIDWVLYTTKNNKGIKYDFVVHPGANPAQIKMKYIGAGTPVLKDEHTLTIETPFGNIQEGNLLTYNGSYRSVNKKEITSSYQLNDNNEVSFNIANYNRQADLVIDPPVVWGTYYGGGDEDFGFDITTSASGNILLTGMSYNSGTAFPIINPGGGAYFTGPGNSFDVFIIKFDPSGTLIWGTLYAGGFRDAGSGIATDGNGNIYVVGTTHSAAYSSFPLLDIGGGTFFEDELSGGMAIGSSAIILQFDSSGVRKWNTFFGGTGNGLYTHAAGVAVFEDNVYVTGTTDGGLAILDEGGGAYIDNVTNGGRDGFLAKFDTSGILKHSTYLGGTADDFIGNFRLVVAGELREIHSSNLNVDGVGNVYLTGATKSTDFPLKNATQGTSGGLNDAFITKFSATGAMEWSTYYGGTGDDIGYGITINNTGDVYVAGSTASSNFPLQSLAGAYNQTTLGNGGGGAMDAFILKLNTTGVRSWATYFGGNGNDAAYSIDNDFCGNIFLTGETSSTTNFSTLDPADGSYFKATNSGDDDAFILKFTPLGAQEWATFLGGSVADHGRSIHVSDAEDLFITGNSRSTNFLPLVDMGGTSHFDNTNDAATSWDDMIILKVAGGGVGGGSLILGPDTGFCAGETIALKVTGGTIPYTWNTTAGTPADTLDSLVVSTPGTYWVSDSTTCGFSTDTIEVLTNPTLTLNIEALDTILCPAPAIDSVMLYVSGGISYLWSTGETTDTIYVDIANIYSVASDTIACAGKLTDEITVLLDPGVTVDFGRPDSSCAGVAFVLDAGNPSGTYLWSTGETSQTIALTSTGTFWGTATNINGCSASDTFNLIAKPTVSISIDPLCGSIMINTSVSLGSAAVSYLWSPSGETTADIEVSTSAVYQINIFDGFCADSASVDITASALEDLTPIILPNVFTPNSDGVNDEFGIGSSDLFDEFSLKIYNRWGTLLFEATDVSEKWDGTDNNGDINEGVYFWIIHYKPTCFPDLEDTATGTVSVLR